MLVEKTFLISISKKHTQIEVASFEFKTLIDEFADVNYIGTRMDVSMWASMSPLIPRELTNDAVRPRLLPEYWISSVCLN